MSILQRGQEVTGGLRSCSAPAPRSAESWDVGSDKERSMTHSVWLPLALKISIVEADLEVFVLHTS